MTLRLEMQVVCRTRDLPAAADFQRWAGSALQGQRAATELVIRVVDVDESAQLNERFRGKPGPTNVLSFPFLAPPEVQSELLGDLVISAPVVLREASEQGKPAAAHWAHMVVHGVLHLLGHDHQMDAEAGEMESREKKVLRDLGFADPYEDGAAV